MTAEDMLTSMVDFHKNYKPIRIKTGQYKFLYSPWWLDEPFGKVKCSFKIRVSALVPSDIKREWHDPAKHLKRDELQNAISALQSCGLPKSLVKEAIDICEEAIEECNKSRKLYIEHHNKSIDDNVSATCDLFEEELDIAKCAVRKMYGIDVEDIPFMVEGAHYETDDRGRIIYSSPILTSHLNDQYSFKDLDHTDLLSCFRLISKSYKYQI